MIGAPSSFLANSFVEHYLRGNAQASPATIYMSLNIANPKSLDFTALGEPLTGQSGAAASIVAGAPAGQARVTGLTGMVADSAERYLEITGAASGGNNGNFPIATFVDANTVDIVNGSAVIPDANNGSISWQEREPPTELGTGIGYARSAITFAAGAVVGNAFEALNDSAAVFGPATSDWPGVTHYGLHDAVSGGNLLNVGRLSPGAVVVTNGSYLAGVGEVLFRIPLVL